MNWIAMAPGSLRKFHALSVAQSSCFTYWVHVHLTGTYNYLTVVIYMTIIKLTVVNYFQHCTVSTQYYRCAVLQNKWYSHHKTISLVLKSINFLSSHFIGPTINQPLSFLFSVLRSWNRLITLWLLKMDESPFRFSNAKPIH